jgi:hypothetical protein
LLGGIAYLIMRKYSFVQSSMIAFRRFGQGYRNSGPECCWLTAAVMSCNGIFARQVTNNNCGSQL